MGAAILPRLPLPLTWPPSAQPEQPTRNDISYLTLSGVQMLRRVALVWRADFQRETDMEALVQVLREFH
jgi:hypothetical protein